MINTCLNRAVLAVHHRSDSIVIDVINAPTEYDSDYFVFFFSSNMKWQNNRIDPNTQNFFLMADYTRKIIEIPSLFDHHPFPSTTISFSFEAEIEPREENET